MFSGALYDIAFAMWPLWSTAIAGFILFRVFRFLWRTNKNLSSFRRF